MSDFLGADAATLGNKRVEPVLPDRGGDLLAIPVDHQGALERGVGPPEVVAEGIRGPPQPCCLLPRLAIASETSQQLERQPDVQAFAQLQGHAQTLAPKLLGVVEVAREAGHQAQDEQAVRQVAGITRLLARGDSLSCVRMGLAQIVLEQGDHGQERTHVRDPAAVVLLVEEAARLLEAGARVVIPGVGEQLDLCHEGQGPRPSLG